MAKTKRARQAARKVKDRWRSKTWYQVLTPEMFNAQPIAETLSDDPEKVLGRVLETTMQDVAGDYSKMHVKLYFRVHRVRGQEALTDFVGHELTSDYIRRLTRRKRSKIDVVVDVSTVDGWNIRVKPVAITNKRIKSSQARAVRSAAVKVVEERANACTVPEFVKEMLDGDLATSIYKEAKPVYPVKRVEIRKSEVHGLGARPDDGLIVASRSEPEEKRSADEGEEEGEESEAEAEAETEAEAAAGEEE